jgi:micrococcal nuclease
VGALPYGALLLYPALPENDDFEEVEDGAGGMRDHGAMYEYRAELVRVVDGDTVILHVDCGFTMWRRHDSYRLGRIDAPEMSTPEGRIAKAALEAHLQGKALVVQTQKADKYGRYLVEVFANGACVNDWLVAEGHAVYRVY